MATTQVSQVNIDPTLEQKILLASQQAAAIASIFAPAAAQAIQLGVQIEPIIHSFIGMFAGIFRHHVKVIPPPVPDGQIPGQGK